MHSGNQRREHARKMVKAAGYAMGGMVGLEGAKKDEPFKYKRVDGGNDGYRGGGRVSERKREEEEEKKERRHEKMADGGLSGKTPSELHTGGGENSRAMHRADGGGIGQEGGKSPHRPGGKGNHYEWHHDGKHQPPHMKEVAGGFKDGGGLPGMPKAHSVHDLGYAAGGLHKKHGHKPKLPSMAGGPMSVPPMPPMTDTPPMPNPMTAGPPAGSAPMDGGMPASPPMKKGGILKKGPHRKRH